MSTVLLSGWNSRLCRIKEYGAMREIEIHDYARQLLEAHGAKDIAEAARMPLTLKPGARWNWPEPGGMSKTQ
jgi:hypothetical protein